MSCHVHPCNRACSLQDPIAVQAGVTLREIVHDRLIKPHASSAALMQQQSLQTEVSTGVVRLMLPCGDLGAAGAPASQHQEAFDREPISRFGSVISTFTGADVAICAVPSEAFMCCSGVLGRLAAGLSRLLGCAAIASRHSAFLFPCTHHKYSMPWLMAECLQS